MSDDNKPQTLDGRPAEPLPEGWGRPSAQPRAGRWEGSGRNTPVTLGSLNRSTQVPPPIPEREGAEMYAGGERSGLAIQNPNERGAGGGGAGAAAGPSQTARGMVEGILQQAVNSASGSAAPERDPWSGLGHTLGSDEVDSTTVGAPAAQEEVQRRTLTFWSDGFSIEDGPLHAYDAPGNRELLAAIHAGRAPLSLFNVQFDQPLELVVQQRTNEAYVEAPKKPASAFSGEGNRLGSVVPTISGANTPVNRSSTASPAAAPAAAPAGIKLDASKPAANVQLRLGDGSRIVARVNLDHTVADLRAFVSASRPDPREFVLQTTFPSRELNDSETIESAKLANAVVVQRFK